ncbi:MAG: 4-phosphoerythronate dehydrogenase [Pseudohongiellaceae bacterium]
MSNPSDLKIVADADLYRVSEIFADLGELQLVPGREISSAHVQNADALLVRSITKVNQELLKGSSIKFVGSATSGIDHIDLELLDIQGIHFKDAKGCNANAVVDYCFVVLSKLNYIKEERLRSLKVGILGYGAIGSLFAQKLNALGATVLINDPPLEQMQNLKGASHPEFSSLEEIANCDVISIHTPLINSGDFPTRDLIDEDFLQQLSENSLLINSCRGGVVNENAVLDVLEKRNDILFVFDVWTNEPNVLTELVSKVRFATPHIAGYSTESKLAAVSSLRDGFVNYFQLDSGSNVSKANSRNGEDEQHQIKNIEQGLETSFDIEKLSFKFKHAVTEENAIAYFDQARKDLLARREIRSLPFQLINKNAFEQKVIRVLSA